MSFSPADSLLYRDLLGDAEMATLFSDSAEVRAMMLVLGALAKVQGKAGVIPEVSGQFLHRATMEIQIDPGGLTEATGQDGISVPALVAAMRKALDAPEHAQYLHRGATSQDIQDTALMLRMRRALALIRDRQAALLATLADLADAHAGAPQAARADGPVAVAARVGALAAAWGAPLLRARDALGALEDGVPCVSLSAAGGRGPDPAAIRMALAEALGLRDPGASWQDDRGRIADLAGWLSDVAQATGHLGADVLRLTASGPGAVGQDEADSTSATPRDQTMVRASVLVALARTSAAQASVLTGKQPGEARDSAALYAEWLTLPQVVVACAKSLSVARACVDALAAQTDPVAALSPTDTPRQAPSEARSFASAVRDSLKSDRPA